MTAALDVLSGVLLAAGLLFFISGSIGMLRFPDVFSRLHAVTKADTVGLGLIVASLSCRSDGLHAVTVMLFVWLLVMASGAVACHLLARFSQGGSDASVKQKGHH